MIVSRLGFNIPPILAIGPACGGTVQKSVTPTRRSPSPRAKIESVTLGARDTTRRGDAGTEDLRLAMVHYRTLFEDLSFRAGDEARIGLVGRNGTGKTTLLRILAGTVQPERGTRSVSPHVRVARLFELPIARLRLTRAERRRSRLLDSSESGRR